MSRKTASLFGSLRTPATTSVTVEHIRRQHQARAQQRAALVSQRQALAHAELRGERAAIDLRRALAQKIAALDQELLTLADALPTAIAHEQAAVQQERQQLVAELRKAFSEREQAREALFTRLAAAPLPSIEDMQSLRLIAKECSDIGFAIAAATGEKFIPVDALQTLRSAMHDRHVEFERRWMHTRPTGKPDFTDRPWRATVERLRTLREPA
jgi:exonuclease VII large subunit